MMFGAATGGFVYTTVTPGEMTMNYVDYTGAVLYTTTRVQTRAVKYPTAEPTLEPTRVPTPNPSPNPTTSPSSSPSISHFPTREPTVDMGLSRYTGKYQQRGWSASSASDNKVAGSNTGASSYSKYDMSMSDGSEGSANLLGDMVDVEGDSTGSISVDSNVKSSSSAGEENASWLTEEVQFNGYSIRTLKVNILADILLFAVCVVIAVMVYKIGRYAIALEIENPVLSTSKDVSGDMEKANQTISAHGTLSEASTTHGLLSLETSAKYGLPELTVGAEVLSTRNLHSSETFSRLDGGMADKGAITAASGCGIENVRLESKKGGDGDVVFLL